MNWMFLPFQRYFDFEGRSRRMEFWMFQVLNTIVGLVLAGPFFFGMFSAAIAVESDSFASDEAAAEAMMTGIGAFGWAGIGLYSLYALAAFIPAIAVTVRRLHDRDMSGWWYAGLIVVSFIPFVGLLASVAFIVLMFLPGTQGENRFGPDPKNPYNEEVFT